MTQMGGYTTTLHDWYHTKHRAANTIAAIGAREDSSLSGGRLARNALKAWAAVARGVTSCAERTNEREQLESAHRHPFSCHGAGMGRDRNRRYGFQRETSEVLLSMSLRRPVLGDSSEQSFGLFYLWSHCSFFQDLQLRTT